MIGKVPDGPDKRGERCEGLIYYLYGPGRHEEHTDPHIVAGWRHPAELEPPLRADGTRDFRRLSGLLNQPQAALGKWGCRRPVWHTVMRAAPRDKTLSDDEWAQIAGDVMNRTGLSRYGEEDEGVRWIAVRHGDDHIHIVAMLARQDGRRWRLDFEKKRVREACLAAEERYGLESTAPGDRTAARRPSRAETEKAARRGLDEPPRVTLRRQVTTAAAGARSDQEFFARLEAAGVLVRDAVQRQEPGPGHRVRGRAARRHRQGRRAGVVRRREARRGPELAQAPLPLGRPRHRARRPVHRGRAERAVGPRRPQRQPGRRADPRAGRH